MERYNILMKTKLSLANITDLCKRMVDEEFEIWETIYPNAYEKEDLIQELLCAYYQKVFPRLDELDKVSAANGHKLITYVAQKLSTQLYNIRRHYRTLYRQHLNMTIETIDWIAEEEDEEESDLTKYYRPLMAQQPKQPDVEVSEQDDLETFVMRLGKTDREILKLYLDGLTERDIAEEVGISQPAVHKRIAGLHKMAEEEMK